MKTIKHSGIIKAIGNTGVSVEIVSLSACASCASKTMCQMSEQKEKTINVDVANPNAYTIGQSVNIVMQEQLGLKAVFWAYMMPFIVCIIALFGLSTRFDDEWIYGGGAVLAAALYFFVLKLFSKKLSRAFFWYLADV